MPDAVQIQNHGGQSVNQITTKCSLGRNAGQNLGSAHDCLAVCVARHLPQPQLAAVEDLHRRHWVFGKVVFHRGQTLGNKLARILGAPDPNERQTVGDARFSNICTRNLSQTAAANHIQRQFGVGSHSLGDDEIHTSALNGNTGSRHRRLGTAKHPHSTLFATQANHLHCSLDGHLNRTRESIPVDVVCPQMAGDDRANLDRWTQQVMSQLHEPIGVTRKVVVDDDSRPRSTGLNRPLFANH